jgi:hypothetical protein
VRLQFINARQHGDDESYVYWGLTNDDESELLYEALREGAVRDCYGTGEGHGDATYEEVHENDGCPYCTVYVNDEFVITDGQVLTAQSGKRYRITFTEESTND